MDIIELKKIFRLNDSGKLERLMFCGTWKLVSTGRKDKSQYHTARFIDTNVMQHRIIWMLANDSNIPTGMVIDHLDNNKHNNDISNLQCTTFAINNMKDIAYRIPKRDKGSAYLRLKINFDSYTVMMGKYLTETEYLKAVDVYVKCLGCDTKARLEAVAMVKAGDRVGARLFSQKLFKEYYNGLAT